MHANKNNIKSKNKLKKSVTFALCCSLYFFTFSLSSGIEKKKKKIMNPNLLHYGKFVDYTSFSYN